MKIRNIKGIWGKGDGSLNRDLAFFFVTVGLSNRICRGTARGKKFQGLNLKNLIVSPYVTECVCGL